MTLTSKQQEAVERYRKTSKGWMCAVYQAMKSNSKTRGHAPPNFTRKEFDEFVKSKPEFFMQYDIWVESNFDKMMRPSVDRIDNGKSYSLDNIRIVSWKENYEAAANPDYYRAVTRWKKSKFKKDDIIFIREASRRGIHNQILAELFGVANRTIQAIVTGENWSDVDA